MTGSVPKVSCWQHCGLQRRPSAPNVTLNEPTWWCEAGPEPTAGGEGDWGGLTWVVLLQEVRMLDPALAGIDFAKTSPE